VGEPRSAPSLLTDTIGDADVHAFLIADVRGYTSFTQERGDEEAARLAARFAEVTRSVVEAHRGNVLELRGDEALVVFGSPRSAIRGAVALQQRYVEETIADPSLPLTVGIGLDAGEAVPVEGGYRGRALNVAARLCSLARAGEVLASREIVHLAARVDGVRFTERGPAELKGLDKPVHVVLVRSEGRDEAQAIAPFVRSAAPPPRRRGKVVSALVAFALVATSAAVLITRRAEGTSEIAPDSIGIMDPESGEVISTLELETRPGAIAASADAVWLTNPDVDAVTRIDSEEQAVVDSIPVGENPTAIAVGEGAVWVVDSGGPSVSRISPSTGEVVDTIEVGNGPTDVAVGEGAVWVTNGFDGTVSRIDPSHVGAVETIPVGLEPRGVAIGFGSVWVALTGSNQVVRIDPGTNSVTHPISVGNAPGSLVVSTDAVWVANTLDDTVSQISPDTNSVVTTVPVGKSPSGIEVTGDGVWVANEADGTLSRIEPGGTNSHTVVIGSVPQGVAAVHDQLWVSVRGTATSHRGGTLRLVGSQMPDSLDSGAGYEPNSWNLLHLIGDGLVAFEPIGGTNTRFVPDLATSIPTPTDGGRTYSFELREGIRYSNGELVAPADFRRAIERGFGIDWNQGAHRALYGGLEGGEACGSEPATCDLSQGIVTDEVNGTITFHLVAPDPEFPYKLTLPFAYPVPASTPPEHRRRAGVPGTGPYMLESAMTAEGLTLVRNPNFRVWSQAGQPDGYVDRIEWTLGVEPQDQVEAVIAGDADVAVEAWDSGSFEDLSVRFPAQVHTGPATSVWFVVLNTEVPPFDNVDVRRAMNFAVDRDRVAQIFGAFSPLPACQQLPPNLLGYEPYCPYTMDPGPGGDGVWTAPDLDEAQRLVRRSGTAGMQVEFEFDRDTWRLGPELGEYMIELLEDLGYQASVRPASSVEFYSAANEFQMALVGLLIDYPAPSSMFMQVLTCEASLPPHGLSGFCDPEIDAMIDRALEVQAEDPAGSGALWAEIDRAIADQAPYLWLANPSYVSFVSERVGNYQRSTQWAGNTGLLNQLWVR